MPLDIPWLVHREKERERAANAGIPLDTLRAPPTYTTTTQTGVESIHNHYYTQPAYVPWYKKKWFFYAVIVALLFTVLAAAIILGVVLKHEANKRAGGTADGAVASAGATETTQAPSTSAAESTERLQPWETMSPRPSSSVTKAQPTATPFTLSERSQLASIYVKVGNQDLDRRLLVRQEDTDDLLVTEWSGGGVAHYRLKDKLGPLMVTAKGGTPLALQADNTGTVHLFYLGTTNILLHVFETGAGKWKEDELQSDHGRIRTSKYSTLSTAWHQGRQSPGLLVVAYDNPSDIMQLAMSDSPTESSPWYLADVTSVSVDSVPGQSNIPSYSLGGDWYDRDSKDKDGFQNLLIVIVNGREIVPWECSVDYWPPPDVEVKCHEAKDSFKDGKGDGLILIPPATQFAWIRESSPSGGLDKSNSNYDFSLLCLNSDGSVSGTEVGAGITRRNGASLKGEMTMKAISATDEGMLFASTGKDVYVYRKQGLKWQPDLSTNVTF